MSKRRQNVFKLTSPLFLDFGRAPVGFKSVEGSSINLTNPSSNKPMPQGVLVEKNSRIRISNPEVNQVTFDLSLVGRKFISVQRLKSALPKKEVEGNFLEKK